MRHDGTRVLVLPIKMSSFDPCPVISSVRPHNRRQSIAASRMIFTDSIIFSLTVKATPRPSGFHGLKDPSSKSLTIRKYHVLIPVIINISKTQTGVSSVLGFKDRSFRKPERQRFPSFVIALFNGTIRNYFHLAIIVYIKEPEPALLRGKGLILYPSLTVKTPTCFWCHGDRVS